MPSAEISRNAGPRSLSAAAGVASNTAGQGGAIINESCNSVNIFNSSLMGNNALMAGGVMGGLCTLVRMTNCTVWGNVTGAYGSGALTNVNSPFTLANSIVWNNESNGVSASTEASLTGEFGTADQGNSLWADHTISDANDHDVIFINR